MINSAVYIPTNRPEMIHGAVFEMEKALYDAGLAINIHVMVEQRQLKLVSEMIRPTRAAPVILSEPFRGIGYSRHHAVKHAAAAGYDSILMIDDDEKVSGDLRQWLDAACDDDVLGMGSFRSIYGLLYKDTEMVRAARAGHWHVYLHKGSAGYQSFVLNVKNAMKAGNFNPGLRAFEDHELCRQGMKVLGLPWLIYTGVRGEDRVSRTEQAAQGIPKISDQGESYESAHRIVHGLWPGYISQPGKKYSCQWKKLVEKFVAVDGWPLENIATNEPFDWRT